MKAEAAEIIKQVANYQNVTLTELAKIVGKQSHYFYEVTKGRVKRLSPSVVDAIVQKYPNFNRLYLLTGEGSLIKEPRPQIVQVGKNEFNQSEVITELLKRIAEKDAQIAQMQTKIQELYEIIIRSNSEQGTK